MVTELSSAPAVEPVSLVEAKLHLRVDSDDDDLVIESLVKAAREHVEELTGRKLITQTWKYYRDGFPEGAELPLPFAPVSAVSSVKYTDADGTQSTWSSSEYLADTKSVPARVVLKDDYDWPDPTAGLREANAVEVAFVVGYGATPESVPEGLRLAVKMLAAHFYENREAVQQKDLSELPLGLKALIAQYRVWFRGRGE